MDEPRPPHGFAQSFPRRDVNVRRLAGRPSVNGYPRVSVPSRALGGRQWADSDDQSLGTTLPGGFRRGLVEVADCGVELVAAVGVAAPDDVPAVLGQGVRLYRLAGPIARRWPLRPWRILPTGPFRTTVCEESTTFESPRAITPLPAVVEVLTLRGWSTRLTGSVRILRLEEGCTTTSQCPSAVATSCISVGNDAGEISGRS